MDGVTFLSLVLACAPLVEPGTARAIVEVESAFNLYAIGVVAGSLQRQPRNLDEALATAEALRTRGRNFSIGLAQINVHNLDRLGLSLTDGFNGCKNLQAMQSVLRECDDRAIDASDAQASLRRTLSCYYSGDLTTGFRHGYVSRVIRNAQQTARAPP
jgi:type IV secretion system protein VirB1